MRMVAVGALVAAGVGLVVFGVVPAPYVFGPLVGLGIWRMGLATFGSLRRGASSVPDGSDPVPVDVATERVVYWCEGCGAELLLLVRGTPVSPRHCGERMHEYREAISSPSD